jgi:hypothetical protein
MSFPAVCHNVCFDILKYPTDLDAVFLIDRVIQEEGLYVYNIYNIVQKHFTTLSCVVSGTEPNNSFSPLFPWMPWKATKGLIALSLEIDYDQMAMGLPPVTSVVFLIAK